MKFTSLLYIFFGLIYLTRESFAYDEDEHDCEIRLYNESCDNSCHTCNGDIKLECVQGLCKCKTSGEKLVHADSDTGCVPIASAIRNWSCKFNISCSESAMGKYSICLNSYQSNTGRCICYDVEHQGREVFFVEDVCYIKKELGQSCKNDMECNATIVGQAICLGSVPGTGKAGVCKCAKSHEFEPNFQECLKLGSQHSDCKSDFQCQHINALGPLSKCHETKKVCDCWDTQGHGVKNTTFYQGRCHFSRGANETCTEKIECQLGYHKNADCTPHPSFNGERVCQCPPGVDCKSAASTCSASLVPVIAAGLYMSHRYFLF